MDCHIRFHPDLREEWIAHGVSHFANNPPSRLICTFCQEEFVSVSDSEYDRLTNYSNRMYHIIQHFSDNRSLQAAPATHPRPDFHLLEHFNRISVLDDGHYENLIQYTERPVCEGLQRRGFVTPEQQQRQAKEERERQSQGHYDQAKEDRYRRRKDKRWSKKG